MPLGDDDVSQIANALRQLDEAQKENARELSAVGAQLKELVGLLVKREVLGEGHRKHLEIVGRKAEPDPARRVKLRVLVDKYTVRHGPPVDCAARMHLCKARCCKFRILLTQQDLDERSVRWDILDPYVLLREADGYCTYVDRQSGACTNYEARPATCREYSCVDDERVWIDFEKMIPAPFAPPPRDDEG